MARSEPYSLLAEYYDAGWGGYSAYVAELIHTIEEESHRVFSSVCDAACGSGLLLQALHNGRRSLAGYDGSPAMVARAQERSPVADIRLGDLGRPPDFGRRFSLVTCVFDSLNYLTTEAELRAFLAGAAAMLEPDGLLLMDVNDTSMYADRSMSVHHRLVNGVGIRETLHFDPGPPPVATTVFRFPEGEEEHRQRPWDSPEVERLLATLGFNLVDTMDVMDEERDEASGKIVYLAIPGPPAEAAR
jgi:SAM-dependent methyltransferase